jgi:hypothetical protein
VQLSQWYNACSQGGKYAYAYGDTFQPTCSPSTLEPVTGQHPECSAKDPAFAQLASMSSGVQEWEDGCIGYDCRLRDGNYANAEPDALQYRCDARALAARGQMDLGVGFRCCYDIDP